MNDPYQVLNISPSASDEEVRHAYRELARKYHPDNYHDNPLADLAQEKMKEINEAYEQIQKQRKAASGASSGYGGGAGNYAGYGASGYGAAWGGGPRYTTTNPAMAQVRAAISRGDITGAERMLDTMSEHSAEWNFLMGIVCSRRGWMDEARRYLETACRMEPGNMEYRSALSAVQGAGYRPPGFRQFDTMGYTGSACLRVMGTLACCSLLSGSGCYFLPCFF